jgi:hypothetical protein
VDTANFCCSISAGPRLTVDSDGRRAAPCRQQPPCGGPPMKDARRYTSSALDQVV